MIVLYIQTQWNFRTYTWHSYITGFVDDELYKWVSRDCNKTSVCVSVLHCTKIEGLFRLWLNHNTPISHEEKSCRSLQSLSSTSRW